MPAAPRVALSVLAALTVAAGCAGAPPLPDVPEPPAAIPKPPRRAVPETSAKAEAAPPVKEPELPALAVRPLPAPLREALPPLTRGFAKVQIKGAKEPFVGVAGRGPRDVLFLTEEAFGQVKGSFGRGGVGVVYRSDGERVVERMVPCGEYAFGRIVASPDEILLDGSNMWFRGVPGRLWSSLASGKREKWSCSETFGGGFAVASAGRVWRYECMFSECAVRARGLPDAAVPGPGEQGVEALWMRAADDGWVVTAEGPSRSALFRYNGVTWAKRASLGGLDAVEMWVDGEDHVWILAYRGSAKDRDRSPANAVLRFDGQTLHELSLPVGFGASMLRATGPEDVWFLGAGRKAYQWDGQRLRQGEVPFAPKDAWAAPGGEVWIVGGGPPGSAAHTMPIVRGDR